MHDVLQRAYYMLYNMVDMCNNERLLVGFALWLVSRSVTEYRECFRFLRRMNKKKKKLLFFYSACMGT